MNWADGQNTGAARYSKGFECSVRVDPIHLQKRQKPQPNSAQKIQAVVDRFLSEDKKRLIE
jgi:hypothetical protein